MTWVYCEPMKRQPRATFLAAICCIGAGLAVIGCKSEDAGGRVLVVGLDGMDPRTIDLLVSEGRLPNFERLQREGVHARLRSRHPLISPVIWTTIATGKTPDQHGIGHFVATNPKTGEVIPATSQMRRTRAIWNIGSEHDHSVAVVGWWSTLR